MSTPDSLPDDEDLLTLPEAAEMARMTVNTFRYHLYHQGGGPEGFRLGKKRVFRKGKVRAWIKAIETAQQDQGGGVIGMLMMEPPEETALYHIFGEEDLLLYIGISKDFGQRWKDEAKAFSWWPERRRMTTLWFDSRPEAAAAETAAIKAEKPKYNKVHNMPVVRAARQAAVRAPLAPDPDWIPVRIPDDEGVPPHPLDRRPLRSSGPRLPGVFTWTERQFSSAAFVEDFAAGLPEKGRRVFLGMIARWRLNYEMCCLVWRTLQDAYVLEVGETRPEMLDLLREMRADCLRFLEIPCPSCEDGPPARMSCKDCGQEGPDRIGRQDRKVRAA